MKTIERALKTRLAFYAIRKAIKFAKRQAEKTQNTIDDKIVGWLDYFLGEAEKIQEELTQLKISKKDAGELIEIELKEVLRKKLREDIKP